MPPRSDDLLLDHPITTADLVWAVGSICNLHRVPFDAVLLQSQFPPPHTGVTLVEAMRSVGFEARAVAVPAADLAAMSMPCLVVLRGQTSVHVAEQRADNVTSLRPPAIELAVVVRCEQERILYFRAGSTTPHLATPEEFAACYGGIAFAMLTRDKPVADDGNDGRRQAFGFRWFVPELLKHRAVWRDVALASLFLQLIALAVPLCSQIIIDKVIVHQTTSTLAVIAAALAMFLAFTAALTWIRQYLIIHTGNRVDAVLGTAVLHHLLRLPVRYFEHRATGVVAARLHGVETIRDFLTGAAMTLVLDCPFLVIFLAVMLMYSVWLSAVTLLILAAIVALSIVVGPLFQRRLNQQFLLGARNQAFLTEYVAGIETVKSLQMEPQLGRKYEDYLAAYIQSNFSTRQLANTYNTAAHTLEQAMSTIILCLGAWLVMTRADFTIGMLVAFQMFATRISQPMLRLVGLWQQFQQASIAVQRLGDIMNAPAEPYAVAPTRGGAGPGRIQFNGVGFRYSDELPFLFRQLTVDIAPGRTIVVMGPSGCGKSTLAKLLQGFCWPTEGQVLLDGRDSRHLAANELRAYFGVVPQETTLFSGTLYDNLILANPFASFELVVQACKFAEIHEFIESLPQGYQTEIGERGIGLSGGQRQRIAIARALLKKPKILVFDEATSNLDATTGEHIARTINSLKGKVTVVFIAHQLPKALTADLLVRIDPAGSRGGTRSPSGAVPSGVATAAVGGD